MTTNQERLDQERAKLERFYDYRFEGRDREARRRRAVSSPGFHSQTILESNESSRSGRRSSKPPAGHSRARVSNASGDSRS